MPFFKRRPKPEKVLELGQRETGRIVGISVRKATDSHDQAEVYETYAVELSIGTVGVMQQLLPVELVRLGMEVVTTHLDGAAVIDWAATCGGEATPYGWGVPRRPPAPGIDDETLKLVMARRQTPAWATIRVAEVRDAYLGYAKALALQVSVKPRGLDGYDTELTKVKVPFYANHLVEVGTRLPVWVNPKRPERATVDWPVAATEDPGVGKPPCAVLGDVRTLFGGGGGPPSAPGPATGSMGPVDHPEG